jgi:hypothetical protein
MVPLEMVDWDFTVGAHVQACAHTRTQAID